MNHLLRLNLVLTPSLISCVILGLFLCVAIFFLLRLRYDIANIKNAIRKKIKEPNHAASVILRTKLSVSLWNIISVLFVHRQEIEQQKKIYNEIITLTGNLTDKITDLKEVENSAIEILSTQLGSGVISIMLVELDEISNSARIATTQGLKVKRLQEAVMDIFDDLFLTNHMTFGYSISSNDEKYNLSELGIGLTLTIPMRISNKIIGGIWVGFNEKSVGIDSTRRQTIKGIVEHIAGILLSAMRTEKERKENQMEKSFLIGLSHDVKAPGTNALYGIKEIIADTGTSKKNIDKLQDIATSLEDQLALVGDILEYAKSQNGTNDIYKRNFQIKPILTRLITSFNFAAKNKNIEFDISSLQNYIINFDIQHFQRIFSNLISNALKYSLPNSKIIIATEQCQIIKQNLQNEKETILEILVSNISEERIADEKNDKGLFITPCRANNEKLDSSGFGLVLSKILADLNASEIFHRKQNGTYSFGIRLVAPVDDNTLFEICSEQNSNHSLANINQKENASEDKVINMKRAKKFKLILIIDDNPAICKTNFRYLIHIAENILISNSIAETKTILSTKRPDLIVTDFHLKDGNIADLGNTKGFNIFTIPTVILTGYAKAPEVIQLEKNNNVVILEKPTNREELLEAINKYILPEYSKAV